VRTLLIELLSEVVELALLSAVVGGRWLCGFGLEGSVHAFVAAILLRFAGFDALGKDAESDPPGGQLGEPAEGMGGEGRAVVGADASR
jgi:hypothetical protein